MKTELNSTTEVRDRFCKFLTITDLSVYNPDVPVTSSTYRIFIAGFNQYVDVPYTPGSVTNINSNVLQMTSANSVGGLSVLPGGLWTIRQSICPNDKLFFEYVFFNIEPKLLKIKEKVCCEKNNDSVLAKLWEIKYTFELAKILAENCNDVKKANALYTMACDQLEALECSC